MAATRLLTLTDESPPAPALPRAKVNIFGSVGLAVLDSANEMLAVTGLVGETILSGGRAVRGSLLMRGADVLTCLHEAGAAALPIVTVVNLLTGAIVAFVGAVQLRRLGADIFVADLVGVATVREMAAMMTAIVMAGRTGGAYAAQIATMLGNEEIDALQAFGIPVQEYLVLPRIVALTCMMPLLYLYGCAVGIFGGLPGRDRHVEPRTGRLHPIEIRSSFDNGQILFGLVKSIRVRRADRDRGLPHRVTCRTQRRGRRASGDDRGGDRHRRPDRGRRGVRDLRERAGFLRAWPRTPNTPSPNSALTD